VARLAKAFEMRVIGREGGRPGGDGRACRRQPLLLREPDYVVAAPLTEETAGLLDAGVRGDEAVGVSDQRAGGRSWCRTRWSRRWRVDGSPAQRYFEVELPADSPLGGWRTIITPHNASASPRSLERGARTFIENLRRYAAGEPLEHVVRF
jgi:phosphoglycerate dehydrogenase-like enzyme